MEQNKETPPTPKNAIIKGKSDWRNYSSKTLQNGIKCIFVNDKESKTTAMSVCVKAGASSDPRNRSGLAHFCEHMCFLGSDKYPIENEFKKYLSMHGGRSNAATSMLTTNYHFDILEKHAEKAIDIFSTFFISPLFTESCTTREVNAVDSENSKNLTNDDRRRLQIYKDIADSNHYYSKFSTGNKSTLFGDGIREELLAFHLRHYQPSNMVVVIVGPQDLDTLEGWILSRFNNVVDRWAGLEELTDVQRMIDDVAKDAPTSEYKPAFRPELQRKWPILLTINPLKERRKVYLSFPIPPVYNQPDNSPMKIISHLLGHEGKGSCFAYLQNKGYISALSSGYRINAPDQCMFTIDIALTENGERLWKDVVSTIFQYCKLIYKTASTAQSGDNDEMKVLQRIWKEVSDLSRMHFNYTSPGVPYHFASRVSTKVTSYGIEHCLSAGSMLNEDETTLPLNDIIDYSSRLLPENCIIERCSKQAWEDISKDGIKREKWYDIEYHLTQISKDDVDIWNNTTENNELHLPALNRYIPQNLELCEELPMEAKVPRIEHTMHPPEIVQTHSYGRLWHKLDDRYALPKSCIKILFRNPLVNHSFHRNKQKWEYNLSNNIHTSFLISMFTDSLSQETYDADLSGLYWSISKSNYGLELTSHGYSERLSLFTLDVLHKLYKDDFLQDSFLVSSKDRFLRATKSFLTSGRADSHAAYYMDLLLSSEESGDMDEMLGVVDCVTLESLRVHYRELMGYNAREDCLECLYQGNVSKKNACDFFNVVCGLLEQSKPLSDDGKDIQYSWFPGPSERKLIPGKDFEFHFSSQNPSEENGAVIMAFQSSLPGYRGQTSDNSKESLIRTASLRLLCHMLREPFFDELRTKQQLGYIVNSSYHNSFSTLQDDEEVEENSYKVMIIEYVYVTILSRKALPCEIANRIDEFLYKFRDILKSMPESEIRAHSDALCVKMLKPIQKLNSEVSYHFGKIRRFGPEMLSKNIVDIPWNTIDDIAAAVSTLTRKDLVSAWTDVVSGSGRSRVVSNVYGKDFPLVKENVLSRSKFNKNIVTSIRGILQSRNELAGYRGQQRRYYTTLSIHHVNFFWDRLQRNKLVTASVVLGVGLLGASYFYCNDAMLANRSKERTRWRGKTMFGF